MNKTGVLITYEEYTKKTKILNNVIEVMCETDSNIRTKLSPYMDVYGDSNGIPPLEDLIDKTIELISKPNNHCNLDIHAKTEPGDLTCQFCGDIGFDKIGLKMHLNLWCDEFQKVSLPTNVINFSKFTKEE